jgi:hypothetical protein
MQFAGVDSSSPPVIDIPRQYMELLDLEKPAPDACAEPRLGQVAEQNSRCGPGPGWRGRSDSWRCKRRGAARLPTQSCARFPVTPAVVVAEMKTAT